MSHPHHHGGSPVPIGDSRSRAAERRLRRRVVWLLTAALVPVVAALVVGAVVLWPHNTLKAAELEGVTGDVKGTIYVSARTDRVTPFDCQGVGSGPGTTVRCAHLAVTVTSGPDEGKRVKVDIQPTDLKSGIQPGDGLRLARFRAIGGLPASYVFVDFARSGTLIGLTVAFALLVVVVARFRGLAALLGLVLSFVVLITFMIPALLAGENALAVAVVGSAAIMFVLLYLAHGISIRTTTALIGTLFGLGASAALGTWAVGAAHLTGAGNEDNLTLSAVAGHVQLSGLLLAGVIVASLGILNDVTVTQASAVWELRAANPHTSPGRLFSGAMRIGRDHIASTVYTIVFAYAGAALPVLLLINISQRPLETILTGEAIGEELVRTLVGSIGLVLSVPLTTAVGVALVRFARGSTLPAPDPPERDRPWATVTEDPRA
jgi:uncharacterized membrane protein